MPETIAEVAPTPSLPSRTVPLRNGFAWSLAGNIFYAACQWGIVVVLAKLGTVEMLGQFALGMAIAAPVFMLTNLQLRAVLATDARGKFDFGHYIALRLLGTAAGLLLILGFTYFAGLRQATALVVLFVSLAKAAETFSDILYGHWQRAERFDCIAKALFGRGIGSVTVMAVVLVLTHSVLFATAGMALYWFLWVLAYELHVARKTLVDDPMRGRLWPSWDDDQLKQLCKLVLPLGIVAVLASLNANLPRYFIERFLGEQALGYFAAAAYIPLAGATVILALSQSAAPRLARLYISSRRSFVSLLARMLILTALLGTVGFAIAFLFGRPLLAFFYLPAYSQYSVVFAWLMLAGALNYVVTILCGAMTSAGIFRAQMGIFLAATATILIGSYVLVPRFGLEGAAYALLAGAGVSCAVAMGLCAWAWRSSFRELRLREVTPAGI